MAIQELHSDRKYAILNKIWPRMTRGDFDTYMDLYDRYFLFLEEQMCLIERKSILYSTKSIDELTSTIEHIRQFPQKPKFELFESSSDETMRSADMAIRIWLTIDIQHSTPDSRTSRVWPNFSSLRFLVGGWPFPSRKYHDGNRQIPQSFSVANLTRYYDFQVNWTSDLTQHLTIDWKYKQITIFEHAICLRNHLAYPDDCPLPKILVQEAVDTIKLLFPDDKDTKAFLSREGRKLLKIPFGRERSLSLGDFSYWETEISQLLDVWEQGPSGWSQLRLRPDRSNFLEYSTFWAAAVVLLLTVISIVFGVAGLVLAKKALDVSVKSLDVSVKSYELSLAIACAEANATDTLPAFCK
ncbi:uncharacterized protein BKA55DRAFT_566228 [Fusarium redolens]|uniref:Uncharacterized protein n=1 Tax=Fusarium redolens TaxID=48865 RepID=A0A9P9KIG9_FUSRE|nr:uncharacterized protein BKA55DRAFT_566228 [Fusarium redolens]KAH7253769.1 hypothetical protein BKA55DRAFT_566228 [Fusarium redolens]